MQWCEVAGLQSCLGRGTPDKTQHDSEDRWLTRHQPGEIHPRKLVQARQRTPVLEACMRGFAVMERLELRLKARREAAVKYLRGFTTGVADRNAGTSMHQEALQV